MSLYTDELSTTVGTLKLKLPNGNGFDQTGDTAINTITVQAVANSAAADVVTISNAPFGQASTLTIPDPGSATAKFVLDTGTAGSITATYVREGVSTITAGTTQTQAGATPITAGLAYVTTGNAGDGVILPALSTALIGTTISLINASAAAGRVYCPGATSTNTINGTAGATGVVYAASKTLFLVAVSATAWVSTLSN